MYFILSFSRRANGVLLSGFGLAVVVPFYSEPGSDASLGVLVNQALDGVVGHAHLLCERRHLSTGIFFELLQGFSVGCFDTHWCLLSEFWRR